MRQERTRDLTVGERVWYYQDALLYVGEVTEARKVLEGEPHEFTMYTIRTLSRTRIQQVHRSELFAAPEERKALIRKLDEDEDRLRRYREELEDQEDEHVPEMGDDC